MPVIDAQHPLFKDFKPLWDQIKTCIGGEKPIKDAGTLYLPKPNPLDLSPENAARYEAYKTRAVFHNATGRTVSNMVGQCFAVDPVFTGPDALKPLLEDIDGAGVNAAQQSKKALGHVVAYSRAGLFVDYPKTAGPTSKKDAEENGIRAKCLLFEPWRVINWRVLFQGAKSKLSLVVMSEDYVFQDDGFLALMGIQYRVLRLVNNVYTVEVWRKAVDGGSWELQQDMSGTPIDGAGNPFNEIPFVFIGAEANDSLLEKPLMEDISNVNLAHYRNSADYEESVYLTGQPTPWLSGLTKDWVDDVMKGKIMLGSRSCIPLPENATAGLLQAAPNSLPKEAMDQKEELMRELGAKLVEAAEVAKTATEAGIHEAATTSTLSSCCKNVSAAYGRAFRWAAQFENVTVADTPEALTYELNTEFAVSRLTDAEQGSILNLWKGGLITFEEARDKLKNGGVAYLDDAKAKEQMDLEAESDLAKAQAELDAQTAAQAHLLAVKGGAPPAKPGAPPAAPAKPGKAAPVKPAAA